MSEIGHILIPNDIYLIISVGQWADVYYDHVITNQFYHQLFRFNPVLDFFTYC
jgi:hypothetical protein